LFSEFFVTSVPLSFLIGSIARKSVGARRKPEDLYDAEDPPRVNDRRGRTSKDERGRRSKYPKMVDFLFDGTINAIYRYEREKDRQIPWQESDFSLFIPSL